MIDIPSEKVSTLESLIDYGIVKVSRQILVDDTDRSDFEQMADGVTKIQMESGTTVHFYALTELNSVGVSPGPMRKYGDSYKLIDVSDNDFWVARLRKKIKSIKVLKSKYSSPSNPSEFAVMLVLEDGLKAYFEYLDDENFPDTARVVGEYTGPDCCIHDI